MRTPKVPLIDAESVRCMLMNEGFDILVVGAGHGGAQVALSLRQKGFAGTIGIVNGEPCLPYERPPLSKAVLAGSKGFDRIEIRSQAIWDKQRIELINGVCVTGLDPASHRATLDDGRELSYGNLVWAAGGRVRKLSCPGSQLDGLHTIKTRQDVERLRLQLDRPREIVIVGGGYIGLESAATLVGLGMRVTVVEAQARLLARVAGPEMSEFYERVHRENGVRIETSTTVAEVRGESGTARAVLLADGRQIAADAVIVGIGIVPNTEVLAAAGACVGNGVQVDEYCRTSLSAVYAIGDCSLHPNRYAHDKVVRLESVQNATDQANAVANTLMGHNTPYNVVPWFWSDQFAFKLQTVGISTGYEDVVIRGEQKRGSFAVIYRRDGRVVAMDCVNAARDFVQGRSLIASGARPSRAQLSDVGVDLRSLAA